MAKKNVGLESVRIIGKDELDDYLREISANKDVLNVLRSSGNILIHEYDAPERKQIGFGN